MIAYRLLVAGLVFGGLMQIPTWQGPVLAVCFAPLVFFATAPS